MTTNAATTNAARRWPISLAWSAVLLDGFDLVVLGTVLPVLLDTEEWGLNPASATAVSTFGLVGMTIGALTIGALTDVIGRRKALVLSVTSFSVFTLLCAFAPSVFLFGLLRFLAGIGLGGCLPTAIAIVNEHARDGKAGSATTTVMTGYHVGAVLTALLGILVIPDLGWRAMFIIGAAPALVLVPLMLKYLPESATPNRERTAFGTVKSLFQGKYLRSTLAFCVASFMGLLLVYGLNTWLPQIMRSAGYELGAALALLLTLNVGAVVGLVIAGAVADRAGIRRPTILWFIAAAVFLALLSVKMPQFGAYAAVFITGCFVFSAQVLVYAYIGRTYVDDNRATALGLAAGIGRLGAISGPIVGGALLDAGVAYPWGFYVFAVVGAFGAIAVTAAKSTAAKFPSEQPRQVQTADDRGGDANRQLGV
ncbi:aromatic acid/H+ symport family MFS transporter [Kibdelosporangium philippinense]|uniref:Aromatic acid/H+ symport family MFS transporter n=1 Tax=Kibdelosporangium philippinense TaxID=211113 RepID=A0ABS8ZHC5_9PSEU|nr:aromatic acid/H+ symport family MFS transporter [Kibdelosporangium philippinense]MCE7006463.1 aromatic acid/H+ symport family MFS transporter [Kibdelosporangium philippinense]